jgi:radical SAM protein with 4Fe4S-binding SPASM domain
MASDAHPFGAQPLLTVWETTPGCPQPCSRCDPCATAMRDPAQLTTSEAKRLLLRVASMGTREFVLTGGDPTQRLDLVELIEYAAQAGLRITVTFCGADCPPRMLLAHMRDAGLARIAVSVDGADAETHELSRRPGSFAHALRILAEAADLGVQRQVNTMAAGHNRHLLHTLAHLVDQIGAAQWCVSVPVPTGHETPWSPLGPKALERALCNLARLEGVYRFAVTTAGAPHFRRIQMQLRSKEPADLDPEGCVRGRPALNDGAGLLFVSHGGDIFPSRLLPICAGNVRTDDIVDTYRHSKVFTSLRDDSRLTGKCSVCPFKRVCGGSRARACAMTGDPWAADPLCPYDPPARTSIIG